ncbi:MAG: sigma-70 family RNA polymerase sigma factor [Chloroflexi bacterium]|nr:sigma-70 family RNA polymerase sigma factor [Chloroflexota bacterium]
MLSIAQAHERQEYAAFFEAEFAPTVRTLRAIAGDAAEDIAQEAFLVAFQQWNHVGALEAPGAWLRLVGRRMAWRRRSREIRRSALEAAAEEPFTGMAIPGLDPDLIHALHTLAARDRLAVVLHHLAGHTVAEVASILETTEGGTRVLLMRARERVGAVLTGHAGRWVSTRRWRTDDMVPLLRTIATPPQLEAVIADLQPRGSRWVLELERGRYLLHTDDDERLDWGTFRSRGRRLELTPWDKSGVVLLATNAHGDRRRFTVLSDTSGPTHGVPDAVFMRLLLGADEFRFVRPDVPLPPM